MFGPGDLNGFFGSYIAGLILIGVAIGLGIAGIIWGITKLIPHISIIWK